MVGSFLVFVADAEKALKRAAKGFSRESRALDTVFGGSRNMAVGFWISNRSQPTFWTIENYTFGQLLYWIPSTKTFNTINVDLFQKKLPRKGLKIIAFVCCEYHAKKTTQPERLDELLRIWNGFPDFYLMVTCHIRVKLWLFLRTLNY